ncbi:MAG: hypothetical protein P1U80_03920 [Pseudomonadales bacterium]|nr:hypothetical protein [Pseudomonadales bacterium]
MSIHRLAAVAVSIFLLSFQVQAGEDRYYRYKAANGVTVINDVLPAEYAGKGYSIINKDGVLIQEVPRELTKAEIRAKEHQQKIQQQLAKEAQQQQDNDRLLLSTFSSIEDIELTRNRVIGQLNNKIETLVQNRIEEQRLLDKTYQDAANMERSLGKVSDTIQSNIKAHKHKLEELSKLIQVRSDNVKNTENEYQIKIDRYKFLTGWKTEMAEQKKLPSSENSTPN